MLDGAASIKHHQMLTRYRESENCAYVRAASRMGLTPRIIVNKTASLYNRNFNNERRRLCDPSANARKLERSGNVISAMAISWTTARRRCGRHARHRRVVTGTYSLTKESSSHRRRDESMSCCICT